MNLVASILFFVLIFIILLFYVYGCFTCLHVNHMYPYCLWKTEEDIRPLWITMWVLGIKPRSSGRVSSALNH